MMYYIYQFKIVQGNRAQKSQKSKFVQGTLHKYGKELRKIRNNKRKPLNS